MSKKNDKFNSSADALEVKRQQDILYIEPLLKQHDLLGDFFKKYWLELKDYLHLEDYHKDIYITKQNEISRKIYVLLSGTASAYVITKDTPKPKLICNYKESDLLGELGALFASDRHFGFISTANCQLIAIDLEAIEHQITDNDIYRQLIDLLYDQIARSCIDVFNYMLEHKIDLIGLLQKYKLTENIAQLSIDNLSILADRMQYVIADPDEILIDNNNKKNIYIIESGVVHKTKEAITEDIHRYDLVGEENLIDFNNKKSIECNAVAKTRCCLLEINIDCMLAKDSIYAQVINFFTNKINHIENNVIAKQQKIIKQDHHYITYFNFSFVTMMIMSFMGIFGRLHGYTELSADMSLLYHAAILWVVYFMLFYSIKPLNLTLNDFGLTGKNIKSALWQAIIYSIVIIIMATGVKDFYITYYAANGNLQLFQPDLVINNNLSIVAYILYISLYIIYIFAYEFSVRGIIQNIFSKAIMASDSGSVNLNFWGSIIAAAVIGSQFHMSLFHEFSLMLFLG